MEIKIATTQKELESVYKLRYKVYVEQEKKFGGVHFPDKMMKDEFDGRANTINILMTKNGEAIGTVRVSGAHDEFEKLPSDKLYNFDALRNENSGRVPASIGMLAICKSYQNRNTFMTLMMSLGKILVKLNSDYSIFTLNHECTKLIARTSGAKILSDKFWSEEVQNFVIPMVLFKNQLLDFIVRNTNRSILLSPVDKAA